ncbi:MAG: prepilin peptidase [Deltaproteobacteria bacterium]|nr:prepilin peptidase [Deltaproteobacteria bacterium]
MMAWPVAALAFAFGAVMGSFLNVCGVRIPKGESIVVPGSHCPRCRTPIAWYDNVPIVSFLWLRARCRHCGERISWQYPLVELASALLAVALAARFGPSPAALVLYAFGAALIVVTLVDLEIQIIPDAISLPGIGLGLAFAPLSPFFAQPGGTLLGALMGALVGALVGGGGLFVVGTAYLALTRREGMGGGDVKLLAMIGAFLGWPGVLVTLLVGSFTGAVVGVAIMVRQHRDARLPIPFGPFLALGALFYLLGGDLAFKWYAGLTE